jgi:hypothetical protein
VRFVLRACLVAVLIGSLVNLPVAGATEKPLGTVTQSSAARLDSAAAVVGATVYPGDTIDTDSAGSIRLRAGTAQLYLMSASSSRLQESPTGIHAALLQGTAGFASGASDVVELNVLGAAVRSRSGEASHGRVSIVGKNEFVVTSFRGPFDVSIDGDSHTIDDGQSYRVTIVDAQDQGGQQPEIKNQGSGTIPAVRNRKKLLLVMIYSGIAAGAIIGGYFIYHELNESPSAPKNSSAH